MGNCHCPLFVASFLTFCLVALPAAAFEILLDIDTDEDPATINTATEDSSAVVRIILWPEAPGETVGHVSFGLGGECLECPQGDIGGVHMYGVSFDLPLTGPWTTAPGFESQAAYATYLGCPDDPGYHLLLSLEPQGGGTMFLDRPIFLAEFTAWVSDPVPEGCAQPSSVLMTMPSLGEWWGYVLLGGAEEPSGTAACTWGGIKTIHR